MSINKIELQIMEAEAAIKCAHLGFESIVRKPALEYIRENMNTLEQNEYKFEMDIERPLMARLAKLQAKRQQATISWRSRDIAFKGVPDNGLAVWIGSVNPMPAHYRFGEYCATVSRCKTTVYLEDDDICEDEWLDWNNELDWQPACKDVLAPELNMVMEDDGYWPDVSEHDDNKNVVVEVTDPAGRYLRETQTRCVWVIYPLCDSGL
jgi:hypothetical protein